MLLATLAILLLAFGSASAQGWSGGSIGVDKVQGLSGLDTINIGSDLRFILRYRNDTTAKFGISNGFRVYSPDGATWDSTTGDSLGWRASDPSPGVPILGWTQFDLGLTLGRYSNDGIESDTVGILGLMFAGAGLAGGFNDTAFAVTAFNMHPTSHGKHICIDSSWFRPGGTWKWARSGGVNRFPAWSGAKCYTVYNPSAPPSDTITATPFSLSFTKTTGDGSATEKDISVYDINGHSYGFTATLLHFGGWASLPISSGTTPGIVRVSVNAGIKAPGTYYDTVVITAAAVYSPVLVPITFVVTPVLEITKLTLKDWTVNVAGYFDTLTATGGTAPYTWSIESGTLPAGLSLDPSTGIISGTPTAAGGYAFTPKVTDFVGVTSASSLMLTVNQAPIILSACFEQWTQGLVLSPNPIQLGVTGGTGTKHWSITAGALPTGITLTSSGMLSGTPTADGTFPYTVTATDSLGATGSLDCSWIINPALVLGICPPDGVKDIPYSERITAGGGTIGWSIRLADGSGPLPTGLVLVGSGVVSGTPTVAGSFPVIFQATDALGAIGTKACTITIVDGISISSACPSDWTVGMAFLHQFVAVGGVGTKTFSISAGSLPAGTNMNGDGLISGTPTTAGIFTFTVQVADGASNTATKICVWTVNDVPAITTACPAPTYVGKSVSLQFVATGGTGAFSWSVSAGLPEGVTLSSTGLLAGTPLATEYGLFLYTVKVIDATGASGTKDCQWTVLRMPTITSACPPEGTVGVHFTVADTAIGGVAPYSWSMISGTLPAGMTYSAGGVLDGTPTVAGSFTFTVQAMDANDEVGTRTCTWVVGACKSLYVSDSLLVFDASEGDVEAIPSMIMDSIVIIGGGSAVVTVRAPLDTTWVKFTYGPDTSSALTVTAPAVIGVMVNPTGKPFGNYFADCIISSVDPSICDPKMVVFTTEMKIKKVILPSTDTVIVSTVPAVPGMELDVPVTLRNSCNLDSMMASFSFDAAYLHLASVSIAGSRLTGSINSSTDNIGGTMHMSASAVGALPLATPGRGLMMTFRFIVKPEAPAGFYPVVKLVDAQLYRNCGAGPTAEIPEFIPGGIIVDPNLMNSICGYVVDEFGASIPGATVELYGNYPGAPLATTGSSAIGSFFFDGNYPVPFDLRAHMSGYYPGFALDLNFNAKGVKIVLKHLRSVVITSQWVDYYCNSNTLDGVLLPLGSVIEATTPTGFLVGQWIVTEVGKYGYMPVYRANPDTLLDPNGAVTGQAIIFSIDGNPAITTGNTIYPATYDQMQVCLAAESSKTKECTLVAGWNLVSWNIDTKTDSIEAVLASLAGRISVVLGFEGGGLTFDPALKQFSTLWFTDHLSGYWIKITDGPSITLRVTGMAVAPSTSIPMTAGWNLVSYLPEASLPTADALASLGSNLILAYGYDSGVKFYLQGSACGGPTCLATMDPCHGYWVKVLQNGSLTYPGGIPGAPIFASENPNIVAARLAAPSDITPSLNWVNMYSGNLTLNGERVAAGAKIGAVTLSGTKVGSFTMTESGKFGFMPVYAQTANDGSADGLNAGDQFRLTVNGVETEQTFTWTTNGDRVEVSALSAKMTGGTIPGSYSLNQNYPNPFNPSTTISFTLPAAGQARLEVIDILGRHVATVFDGTASAGLNQVVWDGRNANGESVASGIYLYRLNSGNFTESKKMMLLK